MWSAKFANEVSDAPSILSGAVVVEEAFQRPFSWTRTCDPKISDSVEFDLN
jgi:hypothetical protein